MKRYGVVLAGGQSRRMGQDKALMLFRGERLVDRALGKLGQQVDGLLLNRPMSPDGIDRAVHLVPDLIDGFQGPLAGVHAALTYLSTTLDDDAFELFTVPVDSPFFPMDLVARLSEETTTIAFAASQGQRHPVFARWPSSALGALTDALESGNRKIDRVAETLGFDDVAWEMTVNSSGRLFDPFANVNTLDEFQALELPQSDGA